MQFQEMENMKIERLALKCLHANDKGSGLWGKLGIDRELRMLL